MDGDSARLPASWRTWSDSKLDVLYDLLRSMSGDEEAQLAADAILHEIFLRRVQRVGR